MKVERSLDGNTLTISVEGRLDLNSAPELEKKIELQDEVENLIFDLSDGVVNKNMKRLH